MTVDTGYVVVDVWIVIAMAISLLSAIFWVAAMADKDWAMAYHFLLAVVGSFLWPLVIPGFLLYLVYLTVKKGRPQHE